MKKSTAPIKLVGENSGSFVISKPTNYVIKGANTTTVRTNFDGMDVNHTLYKNNLITKHGGK